MSASSSDGSKPPVSRSSRLPGTVAVRKAIAGRHALVAQGGFLELERLGRRTELQVRRTIEPRAEVLQILLDVPKRERHDAILCRHFRDAGARECDFGVGSLSA